MAATLSRVPRRAVLAALLVATAACGTSPAFVEVTNDNAMAFEPSVAVFRDGFMVAWYDMRFGHGEIYEQRLDAAGQRQGAETRLTTGTQDAYEADVHAVEGAPGGDAFAIGWYEKAGPGTYSARLGLWSRNGAARWMTTLSPHGRNTVTRVQGELIFAAWIEDEAPPNAGLWTGWWNLKGDVVVAPRRIADAGKTTYNLNAAIVPGPPDRGVPTALVAFDTNVHTKANEVFIAEDDGMDVRVARLTPDDGFPSAYPDLAISGTRAAVTWFDEKDGNQEVYLGVGPIDALGTPDALKSSRVTTTPGHSIGAYPAWTGNRLGLAWCDDTPGQHEIYFAEFSATGAPNGETRRITNTRPDSLIPAIQAHDHGWVVTWIEYEGTSHNGNGRSQVLLTLVP
jgi:hypothetical protein